MSYADELGSANPRHAASITLRTAVDRDGRFLAHESDALLDGGAYAAGKVTPMLIVPAHSTLTAYHVPQARQAVTLRLHQQRPVRAQPRAGRRAGDRSPARATST